MAANRQNTTFLSLATGFLMAVGWVQADARPSGPLSTTSAVGADLPNQSTFDELRQLLDLWCCFIPCAGAETTLAEAEALVAVRTASYRQSGVNSGLSRDEVYKAIGIVDQTERWIENNPGSLTSVIESELTSTLADMRAELEELLS